MSGLTATPTVSEKDWSPKYSWIRGQGWRGIVVAVVVLVITIFIMFLSKLNDWNMHRIPPSWGNATQKTINEVLRNIEKAKTSKNAEDYATMVVAASEAKNSLDALKRIIPEKDINRIGKLDVSAVEQEIETLLKTFQNNSSKMDTKPKEELSEPNHTHISSASAEKPPNEKRKIQPNLKVKTSSLEEALGQYAKMTDA